MMVADMENKSCLHWAAQFGNSKTVDFILSKLQEQDNGGRLLASHIDQPDLDGWTPLCWASRLWTVGMSEGMRSEERDFTGVIRLLLQNKATRNVRCRIGSADTNILNEFTPLELAQRSNANKDVIQLLK
jgi:ankyrin repeat protein